MGGGEHWEGVDADACCRGLITLVDRSECGFGVGHGGGVADFASAFIHFSQTTLAMSVWSARDIEPGEEITITCKLAWLEEEREKADWLRVDLDSAAGMTSKERQETLEKVWGFKWYVLATPFGDGNPMLIPASTCSLCTGSHEQLKASDANREEIRSLQDKVVELAQAGKYHKAVQAAEQMFRLIDEEGMTEHMGGMYEIPARLYYHIGNYEKALEYTLKVRHEIDGYGLPGKLGEGKIKMLDGVVEQIKQKMREKKK